ncbi:MAG: hypothetical protein PHX53_08630 [Syntrophales bacterium]|nr:hypothetical protein [Syntrophales bacterium]
MLVIIMGVWFFCFPLRGEAGAKNPNLVPNPEFKGSQEGNKLPEAWHRETQKVPGLTPSRVYPCNVTGHPGKLLAIEGGPDRNGRVWCTIGKIRPHTDYLLEFDAYRPKFTNGVYLEVEIFGQRHLINQHFSYGRLQPIFMRINSGSVRGSTRLAIINPHREVLAFGSPSLRLAGPKTRERWSAAAVRLPSFFPVGIFAATSEDLLAIRAAGFNAVQSYDSKPETIREMAAACKKLGLKFLPNFRAYQADISRDLGGNKELLGFYIEDEPEGRSVSPEKMQALKKSLKHDHPGVLTAVAMVRPQMVAAYRNAADVFMIDPYPVPNMPLTWLSDSLEEAARHVSTERLWAVIQAFGGKKWAKDGWPRRPTYEEMRCLTYLAVIHEVQGIFYFSYPEVRKDPAAWASLQKIVGELRDLRTWLILPNEPTLLRLEMTSPYKADATGLPAVHFGLKQKGLENLLIIVNVIDKPVEFSLQGFSNSVSWLKDSFSNHKSVVRDGNIREKLEPYEVCVYSFRQGD